MSDVSLDLQRKPQIELGVCKAIVLFSCRHRPLVESLVGQQTQSWAAQDSTGLLGNKQLERLVLYQRNWLL